MAVLDVLRVWSDIGQQLTQRLALPIAAVDLTGVATRQVDIAVDTVVETIDTAVEAADTTVKTVEGTVRERTHQVEGELQDSRQRTDEERSVEELRERAAELQSTAARR